MFPRIVPTEESVRADRNSRQHLKTIEVFRLTRKHSEKFCLSLRGPTTIDRCLPVHLSRITMRPLDDADLLQPGEHASRCALQASLPDSPPPKSCPRWLRHS